MLTLLQNPPTGFRQMSGHGHRSLAMTLVCLKPVVEFNDMLIGVGVAMHQNRIGCFHKSPAQIVVGLW